MENLNRIKEKIEWLKTNSSLNVSSLESELLKKIEHTLIKDAKKKGFVKGAKVRFKANGKMVTYKGNKDKIEGLTGGYLTLECFKVIENSLYTGDALDGNYFEIESACELLPSHPSITIGSYKVEFQDSHINVGCKSVSSSNIIKLHNAVREWNNGQTSCDINVLTIEGNSVTVKYLEKMAEFYNNRK